MTKKSQLIALTVDDDQDFNNYIKLLLKKENIKAIVTNNHKDFIAKLKLEKPDICLVDLNLDIAFGAGFQLIQAVRKTIGYDLPIIVMSKRTNREDISHALELGANDFIPKPIDDLVFKSKLRHFLNLEGPINALPFYLISECSQNCTVSSGLLLESINEFGLTIKGHELISKGTLLTLSGDCVSEIFKINSVTMSVNKSWMDHDDHTFLSFLEFDYENIALVSNVRSWILSNTEAGPT